MAHDVNNNGVPDEVEAAAKKLGAGRIAGIIGIVSLLGGTTTIIAKTDEILGFMCKGAVAEAITPYKEAIACYETGSILNEIDDSHCQSKLPEGEAHE